jgi:hypothetical protein
MPETKKVETKEIVRKEETTLSDVGQKLTTYLLDQTQSFAKIEGTELTGEEKIFAVNTICDIDKKLREQGIQWSAVDVTGCKIPQQIKRYARLGLSTSDNEIYVDVRWNGKTGKQDVYIKKQYQGVEKEIIKYCSKPIDHFKRGVICVGDEFEVEEDFETGYDKVTKHVKNPDKTLDRNLLDNITGAYEIAYEKTADGKYVQHVARIDKNRIMRAFNASASREKTVWKNDTQRMVLKTAAWVLYNNVLKPYIEIPTAVKKDWEATNDQMEFENLNAESAEQKEVVFQNVGEGEEVNFDETPADKVQVSNNNVEKVADKP